MVFPGCLLDHGIAVTLCDKFSPSFCLIFCINMTFSAQELHDMQYGLHNGYKIHFSSFELNPKSKSMI